MKVKSLILGLSLVAATSAPALANDQIKIVGSSTVYPFTTVVAERFGRMTSHPTPIVESTGTGGGFKLFCEGAGENTASISNASRAIKSSEIADCAKNGVQNVIEVKVGYDGIVMASSVDAPQFNLTTRDIWLALAAHVPNSAGEIIENPYRTWNQINPSLPNVEIEVLGPPPTSGTRDAFVELAMDVGCDQVEAVAALKATNSNLHKEVCQAFREDGAFVEAGENDNLIVQRLQSNPSALGIFGYSYLEQNADVIKAAHINDVEATFENIADGSYPISRPLFFYVKGEHLGLINGLREFVTEFISDQAAGDEGYLADRGLIPVSNEERHAVEAQLGGHNH